ncbi:MAG: putative quinol monooxygenase [Chloroflexota bacterium]
MVGMEVSLEVKTDVVEAFIAACKDNAENTWQEPGNIRFDLYQIGDAPHQFLLVEVYDSAESQSAHLETAHFKRWYEATRDMVVDSSVKTIKPVFSDHMK